MLSETKSSEVGKNKQKHIIIIVVVLLIIAGGSFGTGLFVGKKLSSVKRNFQQQFANRSDGAGRQMMRAGSKAVNGEIISTGDKSVTVKLVDGSSKIILLSDKTQINKAATASATDLKTGEKVMIFGTDNSDGSVSAVNIQLK